MTKYEYRDIQGWMSVKELLALFDLASKAQIVVEVGSWKGRSTHALCSGCKGYVIAVDHFKGSPSELTGEHKEALDGDIYSQFIENMAGFKNLTVMKMESKKAANLLQREIADVIFIDGDHEYDSVKTDINSWWPVLKHGGILSGHDINWPSVKKALEDTVFTYEILAENIWIVRKEEA